LFLLILLLCFTSLLAEEKVALSANGVEIQFGALAQIWGTVPFSKEFTFGQSPNAMTFKLRRSELKFSGKIEGEKIGWLVMLDPASRPSEPLQDLYISLNYIPKTEFRFGQFKLPLSMEGLTSTGQLDFVERALVVRTFSDRRDVGAMLSGRFSRWEWQAAAFNGNGQNQTDNNNWKDLFGRVVIKPIPEIAFGGSGAWGKTTYGGFSGPLANYNVFRAGGELKVDYGNLGLRSEIIWGRANRPALVGISTSRDQWGGYATLFYRLLQKHQLGTRLEWFDLNPYVTRTAIIIPTFGYTFLLSAHAKWQLNFQSQIQRRGQLENQDIYFVLTNLQIGF